MIDVKILEERNNKNAERKENRISRYDELESVWLWAREEHGALTN
jgi:hypothetical protein